LIYYLISLKLFKKTRPAKKTIIHRAYMLSVMLKLSATKPIIAGANNSDEKPIVVKFVTVVGILSVDCFTACRIIKGTKFAVAKP